MVVQTKLYIGVCTDWLKGSMTSEEALRALGEMIDTAKEEEKKHYYQVVDNILDREMDE